jgi:hypothetical protein
MLSSTLCALYLLVAFYMANLQHGTLLVEAELKTPGDCGRAARVIPTIPRFSIDT